MSSSSTLVGGDQRYCDLLPFIGLQNKYLNLLIIIARTVDLNSAQNTLVLDLGEYSNTYSHNGTIAPFTPTGKLVNLSSSIPLLLTSPIFSCPDLLVPSFITLA